MLITDSYRDQNKQLHSDRPDYGSYGSKWAETIWSLCHRYEISSVVDYGSGKCSLHKSLLQDEQKYRFKYHFCCKEHQWLTAWVNYDPAVPELDSPPPASDLVVCSDVLEHIEPECLEEVLDDIKRASRKAVFLVIATRPAKKTLPDGRNAHLIQRPIAWWLGHLMKRFTVRHLDNLGGEFVFVGEPNVDVALSAEKAA